MDNNQQKWVNLSFVAGALLVAYVSFVLASKFSVILDFEGRIRNLDKIIMAGSAVVGLVLFFGFSRNKVANGFMNEVVAEVSKVTWPTQNETVKGTVAVLVAVTIAGVILWTVDSVWVYFIGLLV